MNTFKRILLILLAALVIVGATTALTQQNNTQSTAPSSNNRLSPAGLRPTGELRTKGDHAEGGAMNFGDLFKNLTITSLIFVTVMGLSLTTDWIRKLLLQQSKMTSA